MIADFIPRVIPVLLLKGRGLYKGKAFKNHRYIGDPINIVKIFNDKEVDELVFFDTEASNNSIIDYDFIREIAGECFMPFSYGGGITSLEHIYRLTKIGVEKVIINSHGYLNPGFLSEAVNEFGSSTIVVCVDYKTDFFARQRVYINSGNTKTDLTPLEWIEKLNKINVGEIIINSINKEGSRSGLDYDMYEKIKKISKSPIILSGGCKDFEEINFALDQKNIMALSAGTCFVFQGKHDAVLISYPKLNY